MRAAAIDAVSGLLEDEAHADALADFVSRFRGRMLETLQEASPAVVVAGLRLARVLLDGGHVDVPQLLYVARCASRLARHGTAAALE